MATKMSLKSTEENVGPQLPMGIKRKLGDTRTIFKDIGNTITARSFDSGRKDKGKRALQRGSQIKKAEAESIKDIDEEVKGDLFQVTEYVTDIYSYLKEMENKCQLSSRFLEKHKFTPKARAILVDWIADVHYTFSLMIDTFHRTVSILDRYFSKQVVPIVKDNLQLIGITSLWIAIKYEENDGVEVHDLVYLCDGAITKEQIVTMETTILSTLDYSLGAPIPIVFLRRYGRAAKTNSEEYTLSKYFSDIAHLEHSLSSKKPSLIAAACIYLSLSVSKGTLDQSVWSPSLVHYTDYQYKDFAHLLPIFSKLIQGLATSSLNSMRRQYSSSKNYAVSLLFSRPKGEEILKTLSS